METSFREESFWKPLILSARWPLVGGCGEDSERRSLLIAHRGRRDPFGTILAEIGSMIKKNLTPGSYTKGLAKSYLRPYQGRRTSFFALFLEGFSCPRVYGLGMRRRSEEVLLLQRRKSVWKILTCTWDAASSGTRFCKELEYKFVPKMKSKSTKQSFLQRIRL